jgi:hypothetical protein
MITQRICQGIIQDCKPDLNNKTNALYVPCAEHSTNSGGVQAVDCNLNVAIYFDFVQNLYNFFSSSTHRWEILVSHLGPHLKAVKHLSKYCLSAHAGEVTALNDGYEEIKKESGRLPKLYKPIIKNTPHCTEFKKKIDELETTYLTVFLE